MGIKKLNLEEMFLFKGFMDGAEDFPNADAWVDNIKIRLAEIKPDWTKNDIDGFVDAFFENDPIVKSVLHHVKVDMAKYN